MWLTFSLTVTFIRRRCFAILDNWFWNNGVAFILGIVCNIATAFIIYIGQIWYSKRKLRQDFRCNECVQDIYLGIEEFNTVKNSIPKCLKQTWILGNFDVDAYRLHRERSALQYVKFYKKHRGTIFSINQSLSYEGLDLLIESIQSCFFINLNFKLLMIMNHIKNRLPNLRKGYKELENRYDKISDKESMVLFGKMLENYLVDVEFMVNYWLQLLVYLGYDTEYINNFLLIYHKNFNLKDDLNSTIEIMSEHAAYASREAKKVIFLNKLNRLKECIVGFKCK